MHVCLLQLIQGLARVPVGVRHVFVEALKFLALSLRLDCNIFGYRVDVGHDISDRTDVIFALRNYVLHEVNLTRDFNLLLLLELVLPVVIVFFSYPVDHIVLLLVIIACLDHARLC